MSNTAQQLDKMLQDKKYFKFLWAMVDEIQNDNGEHTGTIVGRYASHLEQSQTEGGE